MKGFSLNNVQTSLCLCLGKCSLPEVVEGKGRIILSSQWVVKLSKNFYFSQRDISWQSGARVHSCPIFSPYSVWSEEAWTTKDVLATEYWSTTFTVLSSNQARLSVTFNKTGCLQVWQNFGFDKLHLDHVGLSLADKNHKIILWRVCWWNICTTQTKYE